MGQLTFDLTKIRFVKRLIIGSNNPNNSMSEEDINASLELLNRCLSETPRGVIMGIEKNFSLFNLGEHQVVQQWTVYHIGFSRKPVWL